MQRPIALLLALGGLAVLVVLFLVLRPDNGSDATETTPTTPTTTTTSPMPPQPPPPQPQPTVETIRIVVRGGAVQGGLQRPSVKKGEQVRLIVSADVSDEVHLHGYDLSKDVSPGHPVTIAFRATIAGRFEIELEDRKFQIAELEVEP
jgi:hypothetical protein